MLSRGTAKLYIKKGTIAEWVVYFTVFFPFALAGLVEFLHIPDFIKFSLDFFLAGVLFIILLRKRIIIPQKAVVPLFLVVVFFIYTLIGYFINYQSVFYYFWGLRNNFRFYVAFIIFIIFLTEENAESILKLFDILFWINFLVCLFQFFVLGYKQDYLGGLFGTEKGCNSYINIFFCIIIIKSLVYFLSKKERLLSFLLKCAAAVLIAALSELKFFFIEFIAIVCLSVLVTSFTWRKLVIIVSSFLGILVGIILLVRIFPEFADIFSISDLLKIASSEKGYTGRGDLNRFTVIPVISKNILTEIHEQLIGMGLGNCDLSSMDIFNTPFYNNYSHLNYNWFSVAFWFLETGYIGLLMFFAFFIICFFLAKGYVKKGNANKEFCQIAMIMSMICCLIAVYNSSLRTEAGYMAYFVLSLPFIISKEPVLKNADNV